MILFFFLSIDSVPVPISILRDDVVEMDEDFRLALLSQADNPTTNIRLAGNIDTQVVIKNENGRNVLSLVCVLGIHNVFIFLAQVRERVPATEQLSVNKECLIG